MPEQLAMPGPVDRGTWLPQTYLPVLTGKVRWLRTPHGSITHRCDDCIQILLDVVEGVCTRHPGATRPVTHVRRQGDHCTYHCAAHAAMRRKLEERDG